MTYPRVLFWDLPSSATLRSVSWYSINDVSEHPLLNLENGASKLSRNCGNQLPTATNYPLVTAVSGQSTVPIFKNQDMSRNVGNRLPTYAT